MSSEHILSQVADDNLYLIRHSLAHVMAQAVLEMRPGSTLGFGPPIRDGFYYDFILTEPITDADFPELEQRMKKILKKGQRFEREDLNKKDALGRLAQMGEPYKREYAEELLASNEVERLSFYRNGPFLDMCEGPHVEDTTKIPRDAFKIRNVAGAYWRGEADNVMMTRIYAFAFASREELKEHVTAYELALQRDHRKLGRELDIFVIDDEIGRGLPLWLPHGTVIRDELEKFAKEMEFKAGYERVATPHLAKVDLYYKSGHLPYYSDGMYPQMEVGYLEGDQEIRAAYALRPMNCPHHHRVFAVRPRSYRDLPLRLAEYGQVYRWEESGAVNGLVRTRGMCMNDAHIYCMEDQIKDELKAVMDMYNEAYRILGLKSYSVRLSCWDPETPKGREKYIDNPAAWAHSEQVLVEVLEELGIDYVRESGEAAFYGPKIDIQFPTVTGREESLSTVQLDFAQPARLGLVYIGADGVEHMPFCIHRAPLSTHERMVAFLLEHFGGAFPTWLAPIQVRVVTVSEHFDTYGQEIVDRLRGHFVRAEMSAHSDTLAKKVREGTIQKIPNLLVIGERERDNGTVTLRRYGIRQQVTMSMDEFEARVLSAISSRALAMDISAKLPA